MTDEIEAAVERHKSAFVRGDVDALIADYADDCILISKTTGAIAGKAALRDMFEMVFDQLFRPEETTTSFDPTFIAGETAMLFWKAVTPSIQTVGFSDTLVFRDGKIVIQTSSGEMQPVEKA